MLICTHSELGDTSLPNVFFPKVVGGEAVGQREYGLGEGQLGCTPLCVTSWTAGGFCTCTGWGSSGDDAS